MGLKEFLHSESLHHAYLLEGDKEAITPELFAFCEDELGCPTKGNPDFWHGEFNVVGIDESREIRTKQSRKPFREGGKKIFVINARSVTVEAQNALLKIFEDPGEGTYFFLVVPRAETIIPTLKSRLVTIPSPAADILSNTLVSEFLSGDYKMRMKLLEEIVEEKDKGGAGLFLDNLEKEFYKKIGPNAHTVSVFEDIRKCRSYLNDRAPSIKMLLEYVALAVPRQRQAHRQPRTP